MPLSNPFRRTADRPSLRERAADLKSGLARAIRKPVSGPADESEAAPVSSVEDFAAIEFGAYTFDVPVKAPQEWAEKFAGHALAMHLADRTVRMTKPELVAFIRNAGERSAETPAAMFHALDAGQASLDGWANLLGLARARYIVAGATECAGSSVANEAAEAPGVAPDSFADHVSQAGSSGDVLASSGIDHRDGTVSYADANGRIVRHPLAQWIAFIAQQMHGRIRNEISRRAIIEASNLSADERAAWEAGVRRELRSDAVHALAFRHLRAFEAAEALNGGAEPATQGIRERGDAELRSLALAWEAAVDLLQQREAEEEAAVAAAPDEGWPGPAPEGTGPEWDEHLQQKEAWRERHGIIAAENASSDAATALHEIELRIAGLSAASLAGLKLKARVGQRHDDIGLDWPDNLGAGLARDILALTEARVSRADLDHTSLVDLLELGSATVDELRTIRDVADHLGGAAYAHSWGPRYRRRENAYGAPEYNAAGRLAVWIGDALCSVQSAIHEEARKRAPSGMTDREVRLALLAVTTIDNGDPDETAAFARELLAHAEAERARG